MRHYIELKTVKGNPMFFFPELELIAIGPTEEQSKLGIESCLYYTRGATDDAPNLVSGTPLEELVEKLSGDVDMGQWLPENGGLDVGESRG